jgi:hypothetical protein
MIRIQTKMSRIEQISERYHLPPSMPKQIQGAVAEKKPEPRQEQKILHPMCKLKMLQSMFNWIQQLNLDLTFTKKSDLISFVDVNDFRIRILLFSWFRILHEFFLIFLT